jgi:hypothetical protein
MCGGHSKAVAARNTVIFVFPPDRGHLLYTVHIAAELRRRGYAIEYWSASTAASALPAFATFHALTEEGDTTFDRFCRTFCMASCVGETLEECDANMEAEFPRLLAAEFEDPDRDAAEMQGTREALIRLKQRVVDDDVALCIFDTGHVYKWIGQHCAALGVPTVGLTPSPLWLHHGKEMDDPKPTYLGEEPEYQPARKCLDSVPHRVLVNLLPDILEGRIAVPESQRVTGPVMPRGGGVTEEQQSTFASSGLRDWCDGAETPVVYVSFGSMARSGHVRPVARRLVEAIAGGPWRVLVAAEPDLFEGLSLPATVRVERWAPQSAVLAHPKVKAFVSHCGATSVNEGVLHAVPIVALPLFHDQYINAAAIVARGAAVAQLPKSFDPEAALAAVNRAVESEEAAKQARAASRRLRECDGLAAVVEEAEAAIEAVRFLDQHGASERLAATDPRPHLQPPARRLSWHLLASFAALCGCR